MSQCATFSGASAHDRLARLIQKRVFGDRVKIPLEIRLWGGRTYRFGDAEPAVKILVKDRQGLSALRRLDELRICEAYMNGSLDVQGDMLGFASLRPGLHDRHPVHHLWQRVAPWLAGRITTDRHAIAAHYDFASDFYFQFLDPTRCYSQALFERDDEPLETAQRRKLDVAIDTCRLAPGDRVLDVGGGWGSFTERAGARGIQVTSLTISRESEAFLTELIERRQLPCRVVNQDFLAYRSPEPYDAIVILGVMEHLPDYSAVLRQFRRLLKPGGRVYLDASASREKYDKPNFIARYIFPADHAFLCLHDFLRAVAKSPLEVLKVDNDRYNYFLTCKAWAENLEAARTDIIARWGETLYRRFRLYLWGSAQAFLSCGAEAFRVVLELPRET
ncbi:MULTISPECIES: class I SAM-dependent methyltransferase [Marichromatium]|uniref:Cyclopropane-fatty-acyl-phospholipid synthase n=1 Tax=Marichromatium gracile TaxID=1048 RepID=A0A4R4A789_MARGR|nr:MULTISPECIES: class I SAM-dependent methyltransferase [Marichromatium]MBK1709105.1 SAM-dependent methyltransferase [Marichromatium gracile]RNE90059.1 methyltransferase domain-containing protein [Marichromatium sp. AB31]TCW34712.1 cyclopropane-fatty-acyl-phospholipid synthase [Marichromatium gracile]